MIVWTGKGILIPVVAIVTLFLGIYLFPQSLEDYSFVLAAWLSGLFSWHFGKKWNGVVKQSLVDEKTGERFELKTNHSLFWVPMQYWGIILALLGIIILYQNSVLFAVIALIILAIIIAAQYLKKKSPTTDFTKPYSFDNE